MQWTNLLCGAALAGLLAACSSSGGSGEDDVPIEVQTNFDTDGNMPVFVFDPATGTLTGTLEGNPLGPYESYPVNGLPANFASITRINTNGVVEYIMAGETQDEMGLAMAFVRTPGNLLGRKFYVLQRTGETAAQGPDAGTVGFTGAYAAQMLAQTGGTTIDMRMTGDATLTANFEDGEISGNITNRQDNLGNPADDVTLNLTTLENEAFTGTTTGGALTGGTAQEGTYVGILTGPDAEDVAAFVGVDHSNGTTQYYESGVIIGTED